MATYILKKDFNMTCTFKFLISLLILPFIGIGSTGNVYAEMIEEETWSFEFNEIKINDVLNDIRKVSGINITLNGESGSDPITKSYKDCSMDKMIVDMFYGKNLVAVFNYKEEQLSSINLWILPSSEDAKRPIYNFQSSEIKQNPAPYRGNLFVFGGIIVNTAAVEKGTLIEAYYAPVDSNGYLKSVKDTGERYLALYPKEYGFLDPTIFRKGGEITIAGEFIGLKTKKIDEVDYIFPFFQIEEVHLWRETSKKDFYTSETFSTPLSSEDGRIHIYELNRYIQDEGNDLLKGYNGVQDKLSSTQDDMKSVELNIAEPSADQETPGKSIMLGDQNESMGQNQLLIKSERRDVDLRESPVAANDTLIGKSEIPELSISGKQTVKEEAFKLPKEKKGPDRKKSIVEAKKYFHGVYYVQVGAWKNPDLAEKMFNEVKRNYLKAYIFIENNLYKVRISGVRTKEEGVMISQDIERKFNIKPIVVRNF